KVTAVAPVRFVPVISVGVPPARGPDVGLIDVTVGVAKYVNWSLAEVADVPAPLATVTSTVPATPAGDVAVIVVALVTVTPVALFAPNFTVEPVTKLVPVIVTAVAPPVGPTFGLTAVTVEITTLKVNWSLGALTADCPAEFVTLTSTVAADVRAGDVAVIVVEL